LFIEFWRSGNVSTEISSTTKLTDPFDFWMPSPTSPEQVWTLRIRPTDSHLPVLMRKSARETTDNAKTDIVVAIGRATVPRIIDPRTAAQQPEVPVPFLPPYKSKRSKNLLAQFVSIAMFEVGFPTL
jgi:hypothetical protein